jgi:hypothetical protein
MRVARAGVVVVLAIVLGGCTVTVGGTPLADPAVATPAGGSPAPPPDGELFVDPVGRFGLVPPPGWQVDTSGAQGTAVLFLAPDSDTTPDGAFAANINVLVVEGSADLADTVVSARREVRDLTGYSATADEPATLAGGVPAHVLGGVFADSGFELRNLQLFTVHEGTTVVATGTALAAVWEEYEALLDSSLRTLTVDP